MKKNSYILTLLFMLTSTIAMAQWRTPADAYAVLDKYANTGQISKKQRVKCKMALNKAKMLHTMKMDGHNTIYVVDNGNGGGVTLISGFEGEDILGYTDRGNFCIDSIPPALKEMMDSYSRQMVAAAKTWTGEKRNARLDANRAARQPIDHLIQTKWGQSEPFNNLCPNHYPTGCVATVFAQLMKYYNYPKHGKGSYSYTWNGQTLSADFGATEYQWDKMLDQYESSYYDKEAGNAVATLMSHVGIACNMRYSEKGSGALFDANALATYFDYSNGYTLLSTTGSDEDARLMYEQLEKRQPIPYSGTSAKSGGHAFIVDGYNDGLWGINWGWDGYCDGFFALGALNPDTDDFNESNMAILDLVPNGEYITDNEGYDGEFTVDAPGSLKSLLGRTKYKRLTIHGNLNGEDLREIRGRCFCEDYGFSPEVQGLKHLDISDTKIVGGGTYCIDRYYYPNDPDKYRYFTRVSKEDSLCINVFRNAQLETLALPNSVRCMANGSISNCHELKTLRFPSSLEKYESGAITLYAQNYDVNFIIPESACITMKDDMIYSKDMNKLYLCTRNKKKIIVDPACESVENGAFDYSYKSVIETIVAPNANYYGTYCGDSVMYLWLGNVAGIMPNYISGKKLNLFLPMKKKVELHTANESNSCQKLFVPEELVETYKADANWSKHAKSIEAIEDCGIVLDECRVLMPENLDMMQNGFGSITPQMLDTRLMKEKTTMTSSCQRAVSINSSNELMSFCPGEADITVQVGDVTKTCHVTVLEYPTVNVEQPGTFSSIIGGNTYKYLRVTGNINGEDLKKIRFLCNAADINTDSYFKGTNDNPVLEYLDLKDAKLTEGGEYASFWGNPYYQHEDELPMYMFACSHLQQLRLPVKANKTGYYTRIMKYNRYMKYIELPEDLPRLSASTISECSALKAIVYRGKQLLQADTSDELTEFKDVTLYVRRSLLASFRNNSVYANAFKSIEPLEDEILDGIESIEAERDNAAQNAIYNIMGQRIPTLMKGINIVNGKKVLIEK